MKKYGVKIGYLVIVFFMCFNITYTSVQAVTNEDTYKERYFQLQNQYIELKKDYVDFKKNLNDDQNKVNNQINNKQTQIYEQVTDIKREWSILKNLLQILGVTSLPIIVGYILNLNKHIKLSISEKLQDIVMGKTNILGDLMSKQSEENNIRDSKRILVISKDRESKNNIDNILLKRFKYKSNILIDEFKNEELYDPLEKYDLIVFNRFTYENGKSMDNVDDKYKRFIEDIIKINKNNKAIYFWFDSPRLQLNEKEELGEYYLNFSNSDIMLYSNVLESLKFQSKFLYIEVSR